MSWNDEFDKEHAKKDDFQGFPKGENPIPNENGELLEQNAQESKQVNAFEEVQPVLNEYKPVKNEQSSFHYKGEGQPQENGGQSSFNYGGEYQPQENGGQSSFNYGGEYRPQGNGQNSFNYGSQYQPQGASNQNPFGYGEQHQPRGENGQNSFNYGGVYQPQGNMTGQRYSTGQTNNSNNGFAIAAFVIGLISVLASCCFGGVLGIVSLILGIVSLSRKESGKAFSIIGIVLSVVSILITLLTILLFVIGAAASEDVDLYDDVVSNIEAVSGTGENIFDGKAFVGIDQSKISFDEKDGYV